MSEKNDSPFFCVLKTFLPPLAASAITELGPAVCTLLLSAKLFPTCMNTLSTLTMS